MTLPCPLCRFASLSLNHRGLIAVAVSSRLAALYLALVAILLAGLIPVSSYAAAAAFEYSRASAAGLGLQLAAGNPGLAAPAAADPAANSPLLLPVAAPAQGSGPTVRVSVDSHGTQGDGQSFEPAISADGRFVAFDSFAANLVPGDTREYSDVFVYDRNTDEVTRVSVTPSGRGGNQESMTHGMSLSATGGRPKPAASRWSGRYLCPRSWPAGIRYRLPARSGRLCLAELGWDQLRGLYHAGHAAPVRGRVCVPHDCWRVRSVQASRDFQ